MTTSREFSATIRSRAGRHPVTERRPVGDIGIGRGGAAIPRAWSQPVTMSSMIRAARDLRREELLGRAAVYEQAVSDG